MIPQRSRLRRGFTTVELLTVASCVSVLMSLLLPTMQDFRLLQRRSQCQNNLKVIGLALHNYHDAFRGFPLGWASHGRDAESQAGFGWQARLLPYMEQKPLYQKLNITEPMPESEGLLTEPISGLRCPDDSDAPKQNPFRGGYGLSSYSGSMGSQPPLRWGEGRMEAFWPGAVPTFAMTRPNRNPQPQQPAEKKSGLPTMSEALQLSPDGVFGLNMFIGVRDIRDGNSTTIMVSERSRISGWSIWPGVGSNRFENDALTDVSWQSPLNRSLTGFSSAHTGGLFVLLCDGAVRFLSNDVDSKPEGGILQGLGTRAGNEVIPGEAFQSP